MSDLIVSSKGYQDLLSLVKNRIRTAQVRAALAVNSDLVLLYWGIGKEILARQSQEGWGAKVIERLANDLHIEFPEMGGLSPRNLKYMRPSPRLGQLCNSLLHNCPGVTMSDFWTSLRVLSTVSGTRSRPSKTAGAETFL